MTPSYFELFRLEPRFALPARELDTAYRSLAGRVHPDRFAQADPREQKRALELATLANEAYTTLKKAVSRARHLLGLRGVATGQGSGLPPSMLLEQLEWREALEDARNLRDLESMEELDFRVRERVADLNARLEDQLDLVQDNEGAARSVEELLFIEKLLLDIDDARALLDC